MALTTPNLLTFARIATAPVLVYLLCFTGPTAAWLAAAVFFCATVSDYLDGYIARSYGSGTTLGKFLDPLADKIVVTAVLIMLAGMPRTPHVPAWLVAVLVTREIMVTGLRAVAAAEGRIIAAGELGKYKMALQALALQGLLIHYTYLHINFFAAGMFLLWIATIMSVWSGIDYYVKTIQILRPTAAVAPQPAKRAAI
ncbi:MAG TPA: CDP-diacylglycerol--glycerol-3-phosphate 3-phosphatidyltransferase [Candidatus Binataceae bacterium]|nr:CDP-diacylglycerol--glycerol-3-phosphate 3-phosphatidyltransferase [Candidatus Binataceae bacterium]